MRKNATGFGVGFYATRRTDAGVPRTCGRTLMEAAVAIRFFRPKSKPQELQLGLFVNCSHALINGIGVNGTP